MTFRIFQSSAARLRLDAGSRFVDSFPAATEISIVGATRDAADEFARTLSLRRGATFGLHRFSLVELAARLAAPGLAARDHAPGTTLGIEAICTRISFEAHRAGDLTYLSGVSALPGFPRALAATASDLRLAGMSPAALAQLRNPGPDLSRLLSRLEQSLAEEGVADLASLLRLATLAIESGGPTIALVADRPILLLDVTVQTALEREFVAGLVQAASEVLATVPAGDERTSQAFSAMGGTPTVENPANPRTRLGHVQEHLFSGGAVPPPPPAPDAGGGEVRFFSAPGEGRECIEIARRILELADAGIPFDRMAVVLRAPELYSSLLESAFRRAGVPACFSRGTRRPDPSGRAFIALLDCAAEGLSARRFAEYLSLAQVPQPDASGAPPSERRFWLTAEDEALQAFGAAGAAAPEEENTGAREAEDAAGATMDGTLRAPWKWENLLVECAVIGGRERWKRRLDGLCAEYRLKLQESAAREPESPRARALERDLANLQHLRAFSLPVIADLAAFPSAASWGDWLGVLEPLAGRALRRPERVLSLLAELRPMAGVGPVSLVEVRGVLAERLTMVQDVPPHDRYGRVLAATPEQVRGRSFDVVFVPGLSERIFPQKLREDPMLLDALRLELSPDLETRDQRARRERLRLRIAVGAAESKLVLSYPRMDIAESRPRVASFYAVDLSRALTGAVPDIQSLARSAFDEGGARLAWPAPADPHRAIDPMEHDLAVLGPLLRDSVLERIRGRARYLLDMSPDLARSLRTRWVRWNHDRWTPYDGLWGLEGAAPELLAGQRLRARPYSVSALQKFAVCPYQFLLSAIHRLEPREEPAPLERMDPLTRGHMFHRVQAELMRELKDSGDLPVLPANLTDALDSLDAVLYRIADEYRENLAPAIDRIWRDEIEAMRADLRGWLGRVAESGGAWVPVHFEFGFGLPDLDNLDPSSTADPVTLEGGWLLHGVVDLIEMRIDGTFRVTDHKTGKDFTREGMIVSGGEILQPVLYGLAVEQLLGTVVESRLFYCTSNGRFGERTVPLDKEARETGLRILTVIDEGIRDARLVPFPRDGRCDWCDFRAVCGPYEELRSQRKDPQALPGLLWLRGLP